jgi:hypothetical protein
MEVGLHSSIKYKRFSSIGKVDSLHVLVKGVLQLTNKSSMLSNTKRKNLEVLLVSLEAYDKIGVLWGPYGRHFPCERC